MKVLIILKLDTNRLNIDPAQSGKENIPTIPAYQKDHHSIFKNSIFNSKLGKNDAPAFDTPGAGTR